MSPAPLQLVQFPVPFCSITGDDARELVGEQIRQNSAGSRGANLKNRKLFRHKRPQPGLGIRLFHRCFINSKHRRYTHSRICLRVERFLSLGQYKATIDHVSQFLIEFGIRCRSAFMRWLGLDS